MRYIYRIILRWPNTYNRISEFLVNGMKLKKILEDIIIPVKIGDTILVGKWRNKAIVVKKIGKDEHGLPTVNGRTIVNFRIKKDDKKEKVNESTEYNLHIEKYPMSDAKKTELLKALNTDVGLSGYSAKYDRVITFKRDGVHIPPKDAITVSASQFDARPTKMGPDMMYTGYKLPEYWEKFVEWGN